MILESIKQEMVRKEKMRLYYNINKEKISIQVKEHYNMNRKNLMDRLTYSRHRNLEIGIIKWLKARFMKEDDIFTPKDIQYILEANLTI